MQGFLKILHQSKSSKATEIILLKPPIQNNNDGMKMNFHSSFQCASVWLLFLEPKHLHAVIYLSKNNKYSWIHGNPLVNTGVYQ
jgi:hypothetical protein